MAVETREHVPAPVPERRTSAYGGSRERPAGGFELWFAANRKLGGTGDFDLLFGASKLNLKIVEVPIRYQERTYGETNIRRFAHGWLLLKMTVYAFFKLKAV